MSRPLFCFCAGLLCLTAGCSDSTKHLFTGRDLTGWSVFPTDKTSLWSIKDGIIYCQGLQNTCLRSEKEYSNYHFHGEWRWSDYPGNCAVGLHTTGPQMQRPNCFEVQLKSPDAGDIYLTGPGLSASKMDLTLQTNQYPAIRIPKELADTENLVGQWNSLDVFCSKNSIQVFINGFPQNEVFNVSRNFGSICLISKDTPIEWKNIYLNPLR